MKAFPILLLAFSLLTAAITPAAAFWPDNAPQPCDPATECAQGGSTR